MLAQPDKSNGTQTAIHRIREERLMRLKSD